MLLYRRLLLLLVVLTGIQSASSQSLADTQDILQARPADRILAPIDDEHRTILGHGWPLLRTPQRDRGPAPPGLRMDKIILVLRSDARQQRLLVVLADAQQNPASAYYHRWLTPEQYATHFGVSENDRHSIADWLAREGFDIDELAAGGNSIVFSGTVAQAEAAFHANIHVCQWKKEWHLAIAGEPEIPSALSAVVAGLVLPNLASRNIALPDSVSSNDLPARHVSLDDLRPSSPEAAAVSPANPRLMTPADFAALYNLSPLYAAGVNGAGVTVAVAGRSGIDPADIRLFRALYGLPAGETELVAIGADRVRHGEDLDAQAARDMEWIAAAAPGAAIRLAIADSANASDGIFLSAHYIVNHNLAAVMSVHVGGCEAGLGKAANRFLPSLWQQAAVQGITVIVPAGNSDHGCADPFAGAVNGLSSTAYDLSVDAGAAGSIEADEPVPEIALASWNRNSVPVYRGGLSEIAPASSVAGASFAGIMALVVQSTGERQGNPAPLLRALANRQRDQETVPVFMSAGGGAFSGASELALADAYQLVRQWPDAEAALSVQRAQAIVDPQPPMLACLIDCDAALPDGANGEARMYFDKKRFASLVKRTALPLAALLTSIPVSSKPGPAEPKPVLLYSDIVSGPARGGEGGTDGAFVCVYGENFGAARGSSALIVGGNQVAAYKVWNDPGAPYRPGYYAKACGQIGHPTSAGAAELILTTPQGSSNALPFTVRAGNIFFVSPKGNDATGDGSSGRPWSGIARCKSAMKPGDICYVRAATFSSIENYGAVVWLNASGSAGAPLALVAYPGETVNIDNHETGKGGPAVLSYLGSGKGTYASGANIHSWTLAGFTINGSGMAIDYDPSSDMRIVDTEILCQGPYCFGADAGLLLGNPAAVSDHFTVLGNRIHDVGCHEDSNYASSPHPCTWSGSGNTRISTSGTSWFTSTATSGFFAGEVIKADGQMRRIIGCATPACREGRLDAAFTPDLSDSAFQFRMPYPTKLFHSVYLGNVNSVQFAWNDVDGRAGQACRGVLFHSTNGHNEYDLHVFGNSIHDTVCDCLNFATVDPSQGTVEAYNNTFFNCGTGNATTTASSYSAIYSSNTNDNYAETMTRKGNIQVYNNTIYNAGGGTGIYNRACFAVQVASGITATFPHATLAAPVLPGSNITVAIAGLCGYGAPCTGTQQPVSFLAGQLAVLDPGAGVEEVQIASVPDPQHVVLASVVRLHAAGVQLTGANGNAGMVATNNVCVQPGVPKTSYASLLGSDEVHRPAASYFSGANNDCYGLGGSCPPQLAGSLNAAPVFSAPAQNDFRLSQATPLKGMGAAGKKPEIDQDGFMRPAHPAPGAFEPR